MSSLLTHEAKNLRNAFKKLFLTLNITSFGKIDMRLCYEFRAL